MKNSKQIADYYIDNLDAYNKEATKTGLALAIDDYIKNQSEIKLDYIKCPLHRYTFKVKPIKVWTERNCEGKTLNLFAGRTKLNIDEIRNDLDAEALADYRMDALEF